MGRKVLKMCVFHKWSKWNQYDYHYKFLTGVFSTPENRNKLFDSVDIRQWRVCEKCGKMQDELVVENMSLANIACNGLA